MRNTNEGNETKGNEYETERELKMRRGTRREKGIKNAKKKRCEDEDAAKQT